MNTVQKNYLIAKAFEEAIEAQMEEMEREYIANNGIINPDGTVPELLYCMEDEVAFNKANEEFYAIIVENGLQKTINNARANLKIAENKLIEYGLSIAPVEIREVLEREVKKNICTRSKMIDITLQFDNKISKKAK